ncbi:hypothetical protein QTL95_07400 [Rhizobium sp. S152]|uniref:hypothetical protein n=1 Tax=Rhizobium sp. S152 TaxID=3055038 RepID=UPI0025A978E4|nr:hypothetical protein [Rhizobium sp. S152]MDM9625715.1 hypothetical protein [Rhizobium sp. S152]
MQAAEMQAMIDRVIFHPPQYMTSLIYCAAIEIDTSAAKGSRQHHTPRGKIFRDDLPKWGMGRRQADEWYVRLFRLPDRFRISSFSRPAGASPDLASPENHPP